MLTHWKRPCCWERLRAGEGDNRGWDGWMASQTQWTWFGWILGVGDGPGGLACCSSWGRKESDTTERLNWTELNWLCNNWDCLCTSHHEVLTWSQVACGRHIHELHLENNGYHCCNKAMSIESVIRGENTECLLLWLLHQPRENATMAAMSARRK